MVGSNSNCDIIVSNKRVSRNHCQIISSNSENLKLIDLNSTNGTFLNGIKLKPGVPCNLNLKDQVQLAGVSGILISIGSENTQSRDLKKEKREKERKKWKKNQEKKRKWKKWDKGKEEKNREKFESQNVLQLLNW